MVDHVSCTMKRIWKIILLAIAAIVVLIAIGVGYLMLTACELTPEQQQHVDTAYQDARKSIDVHATKLEQWYLDHCNGATKKTADTLTDWRMKLATVITFGDKEEIKKKSGEIISRELFSAEDCKQAWAKALGDALMDWVNIENELATQTRCYSLSGEAKAEAGKANALSYSDDELRTQVVRALQAEGISFVGGEILTQVAVQMGTSAGILGTGAALSWKTLGISLGVGIVADIVVGWIMDPSGKIQVKLDEAVRKAAAEQKKRFTEAMIKALDARRAEWEQQISGAK